MSKMKTLGLTTQYCEDSLHLCELADIQTVSRQLSEELDILYTKGDRTLQVVGTRVSLLTLLTNTEKRCKYFFP